jgi:hypothetical protein
MSPELQMINGCFSFSMIMHSDKSSRTVVHAFGSISQPAPMITSLSIGSAIVLAESHYHKSQYTCNLTDTFNRVLNHTSDMSHRTLPDLKARSCLLKDVKKLININWTEIKDSTETKALHIIQPRTQHYEPPDTDLGTLHRANGWRTA